MDLKIGHVYKLDRTRFYSGIGDINALVFKVRVLAFDQFEVIVDVIPNGEVDWSYNKKDQKQLWFGKFSMRYFDEDAIEIGYAEFRKELAEYYHTNLLFRISRLRNLSWNDNNFDSPQSLNEYLLPNTSAEWKDQKIQSAKLYLTPTTKSGSYKPSILIESMNGENFGSAELLWKASQLQRTSFSGKSDGVGIFRAGSKGAVPVYYISDYLGGNKYLKDFEESGINTNV